MIVTNEKRKVNIYFFEDFKEGRELIVPKSEDLYFDTYIVEKGDNLYQIAKRYNVNPDLLSSTMTNLIIKSDFANAIFKLVLTRRVRPL